MDNLIRNETKEASLLVKFICSPTYALSIFMVFILISTVLFVQEASNINGRWCIRSGTDQLTGFKGLLLSRCIILLLNFTYQCNAIMFMCCVKSCSPFLCLRCYKCYCLEGPYHNKICSIEAQHDRAKPHIWMKG